MNRQRNSHYENSIGCSALISNSLICESSRFLNGDNKEFYMHYPENGYGVNFRILDLFSTIEASVLYDRLYTLPSRLNLSGERLDLRDQLIAENILYELDLAEDHDRLARLIVDGLAQIKNPVAVAGRAGHLGRSIDYEGRVRSDIQEFFNSDNDVLAKETTQHTNKWNNGRHISVEDLEKNLPPNIFNNSTFSPLKGNLREILKAKDFSEFGQKLIGWIEYRHSGAYECCTSILRDMYYIYVAESRTLPYWPDITRIEFAQNFPNFMERGARTKLYNKFVKEFGASLQQVKEIFDKNIMFIPPFSAMILDQSKHPSDIPGNLLKVRQEFMWLRNDMQALDAEMREADSFGKMQKVAKKQKYLSESIGRQFAQKDTIWFDRAFKYIPELTNIALSPADPTKYEAGLLLQPIEWIIDAFRKRPVSMFFDVKKKVDSINNYQSLISKVFGAELKV